MLKLIAQICIDMAVDGHRADITMMKTAATIAAYNGRTDVNEDDVREAAALVLSHRMRRQPVFRAADGQAENGTVHPENTEGTNQQPEHRHDHPEEPEAQRKYHARRLRQRRSLPKVEPFKVDQKLVIATPASRFMSERDRERAAGA